MPNAAQPTPMSWGVKQKMGARKGRLLVRIGY